jgi:hypothetical protein
MNVTHKVWTYSELADLAESAYRGYEGDDEETQLDLLQLWMRLVVKASKEKAN